MKTTNLSRRKFVIGTAAGAAAEVNVWVAIRPDDTCQAATGKPVRTLPLKNVNLA
jgi:hypothetical protein